MVTTQALPAWLEMLSVPAFAVRDGKILCVNSAARQRLISPGDQLSSMLITGSEEYAGFSDGCICLTLQAAGRPWDAVVTRVDGHDIFQLEDRDEDVQLRSYALAARSLRGPLAGVMTAADQLFSDLAHREDPREAVQMARINKGLYQLLRQVCNMSDAYLYATAPQGDMALLSATDVLEDILSGCRIVARQAGRDLRYTLPHDSCTTFLSRQMLERAVYNLLSNALKFSPTGDCLTAEVTRRGQLLQLTFRDPAAELSAEMMGAIHRQYSRQPGPEDSHQGTGLGLTLVRFAAAAHGGVLLVTPDRQGGVRYAITIRLRPEPEADVLSDTLRLDYAGEHNHVLVELSDVLPLDTFHPDNVNG